MTLLSMLGGHIADGREDDFLTIGSHIAKLCERAGAERSSLWVEAHDGRSWLLVNEFAGHEAYGAFLDGSTDDEELLRLRAFVSSAENPLAVDAHTVAVEVPLHRRMKTSRGNVLERFVTSTAPSSLEEASASAKAACTFVEKHGGRRASAFLVTHGRHRTGHLELQWQFDSATALGAAADAWHADEKAQKCHPSRATEGGTRYESGTVHRLVAT